MFGNPMTPYSYAAIAYLLFCLALVCLGARGAKRYGPDEMDEEQLARLWATRPDECEV